MAPRSGKKTPARKKKKQQQQAASVDAAVDVIEALGQRLRQLGPRKWKLVELEAALDKAAGSLEDKGVRAHIQANLQRCAAALHERLAGAGEEEQQQQEQQQPETGAKRVKRGAKKGLATGAAAAADAAADDAGAAAAAAAGEPAALPLPSLATSAGYLQLAAAEAAGQPDARFSPATLLLARKLPADQLVRAHVRRVRPDADPAGGAGPAGVAQAAVAAARAALGICAALASEATAPQDALRMFAPAVGLLGEAAQQLAAQQQQQQGGEGGGAAAALAPPAAAALLRQLRQLSGRALASMHAALAQQRLALAAGVGGSGGRAGGFWRSNPQCPPPAVAEEAACAACAAICSLLTDLRLQEGNQAASGRALRQQLDALAAAAAADLRQLAPFASSGQLAYLANLPQEEACSSSDAARRFLVLYGAAAKLVLAGEQDYLARLAAARKAAAVACHLGEQALAAGIAAEACTLPASQDFVGWLQGQPPSSIVAAALDASTRGLDALSKHLVQECSERALAGLLAAMQRSTAAATAAAALGVKAAGGAAGAAAAAAGAAGGAQGEAAADALDDLLFFSDKQGDASMFGRDWHMGEDDEEGAQEEDEEGGAGLQLGSLPGGEEDRRRSVELGDD